MNIRVVGLSYGQMSKLRHYFQTTTPLPATQSSTFAEANTRGEPLISHWPYMRGNNGNKKLGFHARLANYYIN